MAMVPNTTTPRNTVVKYAHLDGIAGVAMRTPERRVFFQAEATGLWKELYDADIPRLTLNGDVALVERQKYADGPGYSWVIRKNTEHARQAA